MFPSLQSRNARKSLVHTCFSLLPVRIASKWTNVSIQRHQLVVGGGSMNSPTIVLLIYYNFLRVMSWAKWMCSKWHYRFPQCYWVLKIPINTEQLLPETSESSMPRLKKSSFLYSKIKGKPQREERGREYLRNGSGVMGSFCHHWVDTSELESCHAKM